MFAKSMEVLAKLKLGDILMKLGLSILFEKEILEALDSIATSIKINYHILEARSASAIGNLDGCLKPQLKLKPKNYFTTKY